MPLSWWPTPSLSSLALASVAALAVTSPARAQVQSGSLHGTVADESGGRLPGVTLTLAGVAAPRVAISDARGEYRFPGLPPGAYTLRAALDGFATLDRPDVRIGVGLNTEIDLTLELAAVGESITIAEESPLLDARKVQTGPSLSRVELDQIPTARDPWALLTQVPGVVTDRINVGGSESGTQATFVANGSTMEQNSWALDGVVMTDMAATGSIPGYFDFDAFEEIQLSTGSDDPAQATAGVSINLVTRRGTNEWRGSGRYLISDDSWQSGLDFDASELGAGQPPFEVGDRLVRFEDYGFELGGPLKRDKLWLWGAYSRNEVDRLSIAEVPSHTLLEFVNLKLNAQLSPSNSGTAFFSSGEKRVHGLGASPSVAEAATWDQEGGPPIFKLEDSQLFGSDLYLSALVAYAGSNFSLTPLGGLEVNTQIDENFVVQKSNLYFSSEKPQPQARVDGSYFFATSDLSHELKFSVGYRQQEVESYSRWPGFGVELAFFQSLGYPYNVIALTRDNRPRYQLNYTTAHVQDTFTRGNLTATVGARLDVQRGEVDSVTSSGNPAFPELLPAVEIAGDSAGMEWRTVVPRLGATYALGEERRTLVRTSYARYADQLGSISVFGAYPNLSYTYLYFYYDDANRDGGAQPGEVLTADGPLFVVGPYDPSNPAQHFFASAVSPNLDPPLTDKLLFGVEHALRPELVVGLDLEAGRVTRVLESVPLVYDGEPYADAADLGRLATRDDFTPTVIAGELPDGTPFQRTVWVLREGIESRGGNYLRNGERKQRFYSATLRMHKRLSNRWMLRGHFTRQRGEWRIPASSIIDPTEPPGGGNRDGDPLTYCPYIGFGGGRSNLCLGSEWTYDLAGLYQVAPDRPWGFNVAFDLSGRQGYILPYFQVTEGVPKNSTGVPAAAATEHPDSYRYDDVQILNLRVEKELHFGDWGVTLGLDLFNATNEGTVLLRRLRLGISQTDWVQEVVSPRIVRLGVRLTLR